MRFRDLPPIYARLVGFVAGSLTQQSWLALPRPLRRFTRRVTRPVRHVTHQIMPRSVQNGWLLALRRPGQSEPPVLIVPGFLGPSILLIPLATFLRLHGRHVVLMHTFPALDGVAAIADRISREVEKLRAETQSDRVDLVAHSMGGLASRYYALKMGGDRYLRRMVTIATPHHGTRWAGMLGFTQSLKDMAPGNPLLGELTPERPIPGVKCLNVRAGWDQIVWPREHGRWGEHVNDHELDWAEHWAVQTDVRLLALVLTQLEAPEDKVPTGTVELESQAVADELGSGG
jgi:pimeloyl-ACP methyl ester carboxylesterase